MSKGGTKIELVGMDELLTALKVLPEDISPSVIRAVARKPANKIVSLARKLFTPKDTGASKRSIGILNVKDKTQKFLEIGVKGKSLAYIFMFWKGNERSKKSGAKTGSIKPVGNVVEKAANQLSSVTQELAVDLNKVIARSLKKYLKR